MNAYIVYADGGARGNPGPAAIGYVIQDVHGQTIKAAAEVIGESTNNVAEYRAAIAGLKKLKALIGGEKSKQARVEVRMDSELVVRQMNAKYKLKSSELVPFFVQLWNLRQDFAEVRFQHVAREENGETDQLLNQALDQYQQGLAI